MSKQICDTPIRHAVAAREEIIAGVSKLLRQWSRGGDLEYDGAERIVSWVLSHKRVHEAIGEGASVGDKE